MEDLVLAATKSTPEVRFTVSGELLVQGESYPENAFSFFQPLFTWLKEFTRESDKKVVLRIKLAYFNTSSSKCLLDLMEILNELHEQRKSDEIHWIYEKSDEDMKESGEEFMEDLKLPFKLIEA
ncbi:MAG: DUF1987 domain-containing protein [Leptospirales bacterium]|nr:DUF1987 domain-containing protein [Leptospirales bacterium]